MPEDGMYGHCEKCGGLTLNRTTRLCPACATPVPIEIPEPPDPRDHP